MTRHRFAFATAYRVPALLAGVTPWTSYVDLGPRGLHVRFGPWQLRTPLANIEGSTITGDFRFLRTAGPPHLSFTDRGVTFATNGDSAVCLSFRTPVVGIDPTRRIRHPGATLTVEDPAALAEELHRLVQAAP
ncbi:MAG: hypothetical protein LH468_04050 [Nocardioides sp.]|nr:hypothetical protein [Nocardioides sp.]